MSLTALSLIAGVGRLAAGDTKLVVVVQLGAGAYQQALDGFRDAVAGSLGWDLAVVDLSGKHSGEALSAALRSGTVAGNP